MALPNGVDLQWPPKHCKPAERQYRVWDAWFSGDPDRLHDVYQVTNGLGGLIDPKGYGTATDGNLMDRLARYFWGNPPEPGEIRHHKLHIPLAGDISETSADMLYGEPPDFIVMDDEVTQDALDKIIENGLLPVLLEGSEVSSALGGWYIRCTWDPVVADTPLFDAIPPDSAVPEWRSGRLVAVTFWREVECDEGVIWRHLEKHEPGRVYHALYKGDREVLGDRQPLESHPETEPYQLLVNRDGWVDTGAEHLTAEYIPNMLPNRGMRGSPLGRSDYQGIEPTMDALDETWSSLMRDVRLGKGRVIVPDVYLESQGPGKGARFNPEREFFTPVKALPDDAGVDLEIVQFQIRVAEHLDTARALAVQAVRGAGYSAQTFGEMDSSSGTATATEIQAREKRSYTTRDRKIGYNKPPIRRILKAALEVYVAKFGAQGITPQMPEIDFPDGVQSDEFTTAKTVQMLDSAAAISTRTKIRMVHPQWTDEQVDEEIEAIQEGSTTEVTDPGETEDDLAPADAFGALPVDETSAPPAVSSPDEAGAVNPGADLAG